MARRGAGFVFAAAYLALVSVSSPESSHGLPRCRWLSLVAGGALTAALFGRWPALAYLAVSLVAEWVLAPVETPWSAERVAQAALYAIALLGLVELVERRRQHGRFTEERYRLLVESASDGILLADASGAILWANAQAAEILGYSIAELREMSLRDWLGPQEAACLRKAVESGRRWFQECPARRGDGAVVTLELSARALSRGWWMMILRDVTARKQAEERMRAALHEKEVLLREVHHRVKNNLQIVSSILQLQARRIQDAEALARFRDSLDRIRAIALLHETLYRSEELARVSLTAYVRALVERLAAGYADQRVRLEMELEEIRTDLDTAMPCGLILNELVSNALRHAFPDGRPGCVRVRLARAGDRIELAVADDGVGLPGEWNPGRAASLGMELIAAFARQLRAELTLNRECGTCFTLRFAARNRDGGNEHAGSHSAGD